MGSVKMAAKRALPIDDSATAIRVRIFRRDVFLQENPQFLVA